MRRSDTEPGSTLGWTTTPLHLTMCIITFLFRPRRPRLPRSARLFRLPSHACDAFNNSNGSEFADPPIPSLMDLNLGDGPIPSTVPGQPQLELPSELPTSLLGFAHLVLATADPDLKCILTKEGVQRMRAGKLKSIRPTKGEIRRIRETVGLLDEPPRFATIVPPNKRGKL